MLPRWTWQDRLLSPLYLYQAKYVQKNTLRLAEPTGDRQGVADFKLYPCAEGATLSVLVLGDSAAAGVGVAHQSQALLGQLVDALQQQASLATNYRHLHWQLCATTGHTSFDVLTRLYTLQAYPVDFAVISMGVNDVTANTSLQAWQANIRHLIDLLQRKFQATHIVFLSLPPMAFMPALPVPLNQFIGKLAKRLDDALQHEIKTANRDHANVQQQVHYVVTAFGSPTLPHHPRFAADGFHPSGWTYQALAKNLAQVMSKQIKQTTHPPNKPI